MLSKTLIKELSKLSSVSQLNEVIELAKEVVNAQTKAALFVGQKVYVVQKTKRTLGTITKIAIKKAVVELPTDNGLQLYRVPLSMLEVA
tara:strand:- start:124 stop:390 length:267 start_codon:yes stop_codon:yes gene_type:complete